MKRILTVLCLLLSACGDRNQSVIDRQVLNEMEQREPKRVLPDQLVKAAYRQGETLTDELFSSALDRYAYTPEDPLSASLYLARQSYDTVSARVVWIDEHRDTATLTPYEQQLWSAYRYSANLGEQLNDNVQRLDGDSLLYTRPVLLTDSIAARFPSSSDTLGQLLGMWSVTLPKRDVVLAVE